MSTPHPAVLGLGTSIIRTVVPVVVGIIIAGFAKLNIDIPEGMLDEAIAGVATTLYYALVRTLETRVAPGYGWLLGVANAPRYSDAPGA